MPLTMRVMKIMGKIVFAVLLGVCLAGESKAQFQTLVDKAKLKGKAMTRSGSNKDSTTSAANRPVITAAYEFQKGDSILFTQDLVSTTHAGLKSNESAKIIMIQGIPGNWLQL